MSRSKITLLGFSEVNNAIIDLSLLISKCITSVASQIEGLPDNPYIKRVSRKAFVINSRHADQGILCSPFLYDFQFQYREITKLMKSALARPGSVSKLQDLIAGKRVAGLYPFHPKVIAAVTPTIESFLGMVKNLHTLSSLQEKTHATY